MYIIYLEQPVLILTKYRSFPRIEKHRKTHLRTDSYDCYCVRILGFRHDKRTSKFRPFSGGSFSLTQLGARTITLSAIQYNLVVDCLKWSCAARTKSAHSPAIYWPLESLQIFAWTNNYGNMVANLFRINNMSGFSMMSIIFPGFFPWFSSVIRQQLHVFPIKGAIEKMRRLPRWRHSEESGGIGKTCHGWEELQRIL